METFDKIADEEINKFDNKILTAKFVTGRLLIMNLSILVSHSRHVFGMILCIAYIGLTLFEVYTYRPSVVLKRASSSVRQFMNFAAPLSIYLMMPFLSTHKTLFYYAVAALVIYSISYSTSIGKKQSEV